MYRLRFVVFNLELHEGLESAYLDGLDTDVYDSVCDHLMVEDVATGHVVGTYRMQAGGTAQQNFGYYSEQEFDFTEGQRKLKCISRATIPAELPSACRGRFIIHMQPL